MRERHLNLPKNSLIDHLLEKMNFEHDYPLDTLNQYFDLILNIEVPLELVYLLMIYVFKDLIQCLENVDDLEVSSDEIIAPEIENSDEESPNKKIKLSTGYGSINQLDQISNTTGVASQHPGLDFYQKNYNAVQLKIFNKINLLTNKWRMPDKLKILGLFFADLDQNNHEKLEILLSWYEMWRINDQNIWLTCFSALSDELKIKFINSQPYVFWSSNDHDLKQTSNEEMETSDLDTDEKNTVDEKCDLKHLRISGPDDSEVDLLCNFIKLFLKNGDFAKALGYLDYVKHELDSKVHVYFWSYIQSYWRWV